MAEKLKNKDDGYPEHKKIIEKLSKKEYSTDELIDSIILEINKIV